MAVGFKSPFFLLGFGALAVTPAGFASPLFFLGLGGFEAEVVESPPAQESEDVPVETFPSKRCRAFPWWPTNGGLSRGVYQWAHTRMDRPSICDFYWAAQTLNLTGQINADQFGGPIIFSGTSTLPIEPYELLDYRARVIQAQPVSDGNYSVAVSYVFAGPLHWDGLDGTFCPELVLDFNLGHNVSPTDPPEELGSVTIDPNGVGAVHVGYAYLMNNFENWKRMPLWYAGGGVLTGVTAEAILNGVRWQFED